MNVENDTIYKDVATKMVLETDIEPWNMIETRHKNYRKGGIAMTITTRVDSSDNIFVLVEAEDG